MEKIGQMVKRIAESSGLSQFVYEMAEGRGHWTKNLKYNS